MSELLEASEIRVSAAQDVFLNRLDSRFKAFVGGFGSGKTFVGCVDSQLWAGRFPGYTQGYFAPTYRDIRDTYWPTMEEVAEELGFTCNIKKADKEVELWRNRALYGKVICRSMDDPGGIVGFKIARGHVDEIDVMAADKARNAWRKIIARLRQAVPGEMNGLGVTTTPEGFRFVYEQFAHKPTASYSMVQASTYENEKYLPPGYIDSLIETYPAELIEAYLDGSFVNLTTGTVYRQFNRHRCKSEEAVTDDDKRLFIGMDFNVGKMAAKVNVRREREVDGKKRPEFHLVDEFDELLDTPDMIRAIKEKYENRKIVVYPDASGKNRSTKGASKSDISLLRDAGFEIRVKNTNPLVKDRILSANKAFSDGKWFVNPELAPVATLCLEQQAYNKNGEPDKDGDTDHSNDAATYPMAYEFPVVKPRSRTGRLRI